MENVKIVRRGKEFFLEANSDYGVITTKRGVFELKPFKGNPSELTSGTIAEGSRSRGGTFTALGDVPTITVTFTDIGSTAYEVLMFFWYTDGTLTFLTAKSGTKTTSSFQVDVEGAGTGIWVLSY